MDKVEEIRQKPEHEKIRYVWGMVAICMVLIIFVWFYSFKDLMRGNGEVNSGQETLTGLETGGEANLDSINKVPDTNYILEGNTQSGQGLSQEEYLQQ